MKAAESHYEAAESFILRHWEGIFEHFNARQRRRTFVVNAHHVKTSWNLRHGPQVCARHSCQFASLFMVDCSLGGLNIVGSPGFHLNETKNIAVPADQIDLPATARRTIIAGDHHIALPAEVEIGSLFALAANLRMHRQLVLWATVCKTIKETKSSLRQWGKDIQSAR